MDKANWLPSNLKCKGICKKVQERKYFCISALLKATLALYLCMYSVMSYSVTPWTVAHKAILLMEFSRREYWSGLPFPPPGGLPDPGIKPASLEPPELAGGFFTTKLSGKPLTLYTQCYANIRNMNQIHQLFPLALSTLFLPDF